jgi:hypothetical protein
MQWFRGFSLGAGLTLGLFLGSSVGAVEVDTLIAEVLATIPADEIETPGSTAIPTALEKLLADSKGFGLDAAGIRAVRIRLMEGWLAARDPVKAEALARTLLGDAPLSERSRLALGLVQAWRLRAELATGEEIKTLPDPLEALKKLGEFDAVVQGRALAVKAVHQVKTSDLVAARKSLEEALKLMAQALPPERTPIYTDLILVMEKAKTPPTEIEAFLQSRRQDLAAAELLQTLLTEAQKLVGQKAPALIANRLDGVEGRIDLAQFADGKPVLVYFFATWSQACDIWSEKVIGTIGASKNVKVLGVSLDNADSKAAVAPYFLRLGNPFPVVGEGLGWDGELDEAWHVDAIPALVMIDGKGIVTATEIIQTSGLESLQRLKAAFTGVGAQLPKALDDAITASASTAAIAPTPMPATPPPPKTPASLIP